MELSSPVTLTVNNEEITMSSLDVVVIDHNSRKMVIARIAPFLKPIILWKGAEYDAIGDYTQAQIDNKIETMLGENQQEFLQSLVI